MGSYWWAIGGHEGAMEQPLSVKTTPDNNFFRDGIDILFGNGRPLLTQGHC